MPGAASRGAQAPVIIKVGGSLFDLPDLGPRLGAWLDKLKLPCVLLVPGGGATADVIRALDREHGLGEEAAHWLACRALSLNGAFLQALLAKSEVIEDWREAQAICQRGRLPILDAFRFAQSDEGQPGHLPHSWDATSDSLAARVAVVSQARELILLKSVAIREDMAWAEAAQGGYLDRYFVDVCAQAGQRLIVKFLNFRELCL